MSGCISVTYSILIALLSFAILPYSAMGAETPESRRLVGTLPAEPRQILLQGDASDSAVLERHFRNAARQAQFEDMLLLSGYVPEPWSAAVIESDNDVSVYVLPVTGTDVTAEGGPSLEFAIAVRRGDVFSAVISRFDLSPSDGSVTRHNLRDPVAGSTVEFDTRTREVTVVEAGVRGVQMESFSGFLECFFGEFSSINNVCSGVATILRLAVDSTLGLAEKAARLGIALFDSLACGSTSCLFAPDPDIPTITSLQTSPSPATTAGPITITVNGNGFQPSVVEVTVAGSSSSQSCTPTPCRASLSRNTTTQLRTTPITLGVGTYTVRVVNGSSGPATRTFPVSFSAGGGGGSPGGGGPPLGCSTASLPSSGTTTGSLASGDCPLGQRGSAYFTDRHTFQGTSGQAVTIDLSSTAFDTFLYLIAPDGSVAAQNDDAPGLGRNSRIASFQLPTTGTWTIEATSYSRGAVGAYTLQLTTRSQTNPPPPPSSCPAVTISCGPVATRRSGQLSSSDCRSGQKGSGFYTDSYRFFGAQGDRVTIDVSSSSFDTYAYLINPAGSRAQQNDDSGGSTNSRIVHSLDRQGAWIIEVTSYRPGTSGSYTVSVGGCR